MRKHQLLLVLLFLQLTATFAQKEKTIDLTPGEVEAVFLKGNLELIAGQLNISLADAAVAQAKLWDNPTLSVGDFNFWTPASQPRATQFSIELSQLIQTANKRGKQVRMEKVAKDIHIKEFEDLLRGLKAGLRKSIHEIIYLDNYRKVLHTQTELLSQLIDAYNRQYTEGNLSRSELLRLQSALFEIESERNEVQTELNDQHKQLKVLLHADPLTDIRIVEPDHAVPSPDDLSLVSLIQLAEESRPDLLSSRLQTLFYEKSLSYEKSIRIPDISFSANYDRYGGVWKDFIGFGISIDIPFINRNQGNIRAAKINRDQSEYVALQQANRVGHEIAEAYKNYVLTYNFYKKMNENSLIPELDAMLETYTRNLLNKNISMIEYIDFTDAYKNNKKTLLLTRKNRSNQFEELQYTVGTDIK